MIQSKSPVVIVLAVLALACCLCGCSTIAGRINRNKAAFESFTPEVREKVRTGQIEPGFTMEMVGIAWGNPDRVYSRKTAEGEERVWEYDEPQSSMAFSMGVGPYPYWGGIIGLDMPVAGPSHRVTFKDGRVTIIESTVE